MLWNKLSALYLKSRKVIIAFFSIFSIVCAFFAYNIEFAFSFDQLFPEDDEDTEFFKQFREEFEDDVNFLMVAVQSEETVFDSTFLSDFHDFTLKCRTLPHIVSSQSLTQMKYPVKTPFGVTTLPIIHRDKPDLYAKDKQRILEDDRFRGTLISEDSRSLAVTMKTIDTINLIQAQELMTSLDSLYQEYDFKEYHTLGFSYFTVELVKMQVHNIVVSTVISVILVAFIMFLLYRKPIGVFIALSSIGLGLVIFLGLLAMFGRELNVMSALYPVLMLIVGTSDVVHIMNKYLDELNKGFDRESAILTAIKEIGLATLLTSLTTAAGFLSLATSKIGTIKDFGINAAFGVMVAYLTVVLVTTATLSLFSKEQITRERKKNDFWDRMLHKVNEITKGHSRKIVSGALLLLVLCLYGISLITTNYRVESNLPVDSKLTKDFFFFEQNYTGFRPMEYAVFAQNGLRADSYEVLSEINKLEKEIKSTGKVKSIISLTDVHKSINRMYGGNQVKAYTFPSSEREYKRNKRLIDKMPNQDATVLLSKDKKKTRISTRILDIGADSIRVLGDNMQAYIDTEIDSSIIKIKQTGTGLLMDKNAKYITKNLLEGLGLALIVVSILMGLLFRSFKMLLISLIPNLFPLLFAAAILGYLGIELEAGVSIVFAIAFGIAVDDTIHFLSKYKLSRANGLSKEEAIAITFTETGKAIIYTSIILFFGFLVMMFSIHPPSVKVGILISITLITAVICDLLLIPILLRKFL